MSVTGQPRPPARPRDRLGRPLPWGRASEITLKNYAALSLEENHTLAVARFNAGRFFQTHEAWEEAWRKAEATADEEFFKGLAQLGAAYTHYARGNAHGARVLLERALERIGTRGSSHFGIDVEKVSGAFNDQRRIFAEAEKDGSPLPTVIQPEL